MKAVAPGHAKGPRQPLLPWPLHVHTLAERAGFEPARLIAYTISNRAHSAGLCDLSVGRVIIP